MDQEFLLYLEKLFQHRQILMIFYFDKSSKKSFVLLFAKV